MSNLETAKTIASQLGGTRKLSVMIGAKNFGGDDASLSFHFKGSKAANMVKITLNSDDLYKVDFYKRWSSDVQLVKSVDNIYFDTLIETFEKTTGLYLSL